MNKEITIYDLLSRIYIDKAPKKIEFCGETFVFKNGRYKEIHNIDDDRSTLGHYFCLDGMLNEKVEIIEEDNKIEKQSISAEFEALGYAINKAMKCFEKGWNKSDEEDNKMQHIDLKYFDDENYTAEQRINVCMNMIDNLIDEVNKLKENNEN